jgi:glucan-binding YG repeat protein
VIDQDGKKHRFGTLGVMVHYQEWQVHSQTQHKPKVDEKETSKPEQKSQEKPKKQSQETKTNQKQEKPKNQTSTKQSGKDFEAQLKQRMFEEQLNRRIDELKQARSQGRDRDDGAER